MRLIDADELLEHAYRDKLDSRELIAKMIENAPTVEELPTAEWIREHSITYSGSFWHIECSNCHKESLYMYDFCPNCGAIMKGGTE